MGNPVVHFEIAGPDGLALQQYYRDLFGWNIEAQGEEMGFYGVVQSNEGGIGGGVFQSQEGMPPNCVTVYIEVDDLQAALDKIEGAGGATAMPPMEIAPGVGSIAMFMDPANNFMGLYSLPSGWDGEMPPKGNAPLERSSPVTAPTTSRLFGPMTPNTAHCAVTSTTTACASPSMCRSSHARSRRDGSWCRASSLLT